MDRDRKPKPILAARYRNILQHSCLDLNDRLRTVPLCECGHFSTGTEQWFDPPVNTHIKPICPAPHQSTTVSNHAERQLSHAQSPRRTVTWAPLKEVRSFHRNLPVTDDPMPSRGEAIGNSEEIGDRQTKRRWTVNRFLRIVEGPLYTTTWEPVTNDEV
ncbi:hypothetical protein BZA77DRAFT_312778, partial [Pyronema omphalodes]